MRCSVNSSGGSGALDWDALRFKLIKPHFSAAIHLLASTPRGPICDSVSGFLLQDSGKEMFAFSARAAHVHPPAPLASSLILGSLMLQEEYHTPRAYQTPGIKTPLEATHPSHP